ncbi:MAG: phytanoyl-CoA dioxygenase family protein [candidate division Zixibacteria bacterium]|nr:phytanoyl-CoA dioxygenase family protein [candidate division Zixibacteria bacterium]
MTLEQALRRMDTDGFLVVDDVVPSGEVSAVRESIRETTQRHQNPNAPLHIGHVSGVIRYDRSLAPYLANPRVLDIVCALLGPHVRISFTTATINEPGNVRSGWHADWPFNQQNAGHLPAPYPDVVMHLTTIWMLSSFSDDNGSTLIVPGSHRFPSNPTGNNGVAPMAVLTGEKRACGQAGSVLIMDSRLWHATAPNTTSEPRVAVVVRYAPWWLDLSVLRPDSPERSYMERVTGKKDNQVPLLTADGFASLPEDVKPLFQHWVETG